jgi:hypothetical protein
MVLVSSNIPRQFLVLLYIGKVLPAEIDQSIDTIRAVSVGLKPDFTVLADFTHLENMGEECAPAVGRLMEYASATGVGTVIRVIPDPYKDIGMNILSCFHFSPRPGIVTCASMTEAAQAIPH